MYKIIILLFVSNIAFAQNLIDEHKNMQRQKQGKWSQNHDNGQLRYEGSFLDDNPTGIFLYYTEGGILKANFEYFNGGKSASARFYHANGKVRAVGIYQNEMKEQLWKYYDTRENLLERENYKNGKLEGQTTLYYANGNVLEKSNYVADKKWQECAVL